MSVEAAIQFLIYNVCNLSVIQLGYRHGDSRLRILVYSFEHVFERAITGSINVRATLNWVHVVIGIHSSVLIS